MENNLNLVKGNRLEDAVEKIYTQIILQNPSLKNSKLKIVRKKIIKPNGVRKEIDLHITVDPGDDLETVFIFECKNWKDKVGANEITLFANKIEHTKATKGFFIAKTYTKDAIAEARVHPRVLLLYAKDNDIDLSIFPHLHGIHRDKSKRKITIQLTERNAQYFPEGASRAIKELNSENQSILLNNKEIAFNDFLQEVLSKAEDKMLSNEPTALLDEGIYTYKLSEVLQFQPNTFQFEKLDIAEVDLNWEFEIEVCKSIIVSQFDIHTKGIYLRQEMTTSVGVMSVEFIARMQSGMQEKDN